MITRVGINGFGRIGRNFYRALNKRQFEGRNKDIKVVAINDLADNHTLAYLLKFDSILGVMPIEVYSEGKNTIVVGKDKIHSLSIKETPISLPWDKLGVDIVIESSGLFTKSPKVREHLSSGAKKVIISAPSSEVDTTIVFGVNNYSYDGSQNIISNASCTTNCLAPLAKVLNQEFGIYRGFVTTIHSYTQEQNLQDGPHKDLRRARAAALNIVPTYTGAAKTIGLVLPELQDKLDGYAIRVPTPTGSILDMTVVLSKLSSVKDINQAMQNAASSSMHGILKYYEGPIVSSDIITNPHSSILDAELTSVIHDQAKVVAWYDNEWGYANRLIDLVSLISKSL